MDHYILSVANDSKSINEVCLISFTESSEYTLQDKIQYFFIDLVKRSTLSFDAKTLVINCTKPKSLKNTVNNFCRHFDDSSDDFKEKINNSIKNSFFHNYCDYLVEDMNDFIKSYDKIPNNGLFAFFLEYGLVNFGNVNTFLALNDIKEISCPTKEEYALIKTLL